MVSKSKNQNVHLPYIPYNLQTKITKKVLTI